MELNAEKFAEAAKPGSVSAAALCKARAKIQEVFEEYAALCLARKLYQGCELMWSRERQKGSKAKANFQTRCVRIRMKYAEGEFLIANLPRKEVPKRKIKKLYHFAGH